MKKYKIINSTALLDGGSIYLNLQNDDGVKEYVKLDKEMGSKTVGKLFASMLRKNQPLSKEEEKVLLTILENTIVDSKVHESDLQTVKDHLIGISSQSNETLSQKEIDDLLKDT